MSRITNPKIIHAEKLANELKELDLSKAIDIAKYQKLRYKDFALMEGVKHEAYDDKTGRSVRHSIKILGKRTIGIGFNLDDVDARQTWDLVFGSIKSFDEARNGTLILNMAEVEQLFAATIGIREKYIEYHYGHVLKYLYPGIRLALEDLCYNAYSLVSPKTSLYRHICAHGIALKNAQNSLAKKELYLYEAQQELFLALIEIKYKSNRYNVPGLYIRREMAAIKANIYGFDLAINLTDAKFIYKRINLHP